MAGRHCGKMDVPVYNVRMWRDLQSCRSIIPFNYVECKNTMEFELNVIVEITCSLKLG